MKNLLGGKGANLAEMANLGLPVPPGFTITTEVCTYYYDNEQQLSRRSSRTQVDDGARRRRADRPARRFGDAEQSAARLGALRRPRLDAGHDGHDPQPRPQRRDRRGPGRGVAATARFAYDSYRRFIQMYSRRRARRRPPALRGARSRTTRTRKGVTLDTDLDGRRLEELVGALQGDRRAASSATPFPQDPQEQLWGAIGAVFGSWMNAARDHLPPAARHPGELGHRRQRPGDGVRQHGRRLARPASPSPAIPRPARRRSTASS